MGYSYVSRSLGSADGLGTFEEARGGGGALRCARYRGMVPRVSWGRGRDHALMKARRADFRDVLGVKPGDVREVAVQRWSRMMARSSGPRPSGSSARREGMRSDVSEGTALAETASAATNAAAKEGRMDGARGARRKRASL